MIGLRDFPIHGSTRRTTNGKNLQRNNKIFGQRGSRQPAQFINKD